MYVCTYVGMYICIYVSLYVRMYICTVWVGVHRQIQPHTCETAASSISTNKTHAHKHTLSTHSYRIHVQIYPLAGPVVTAPESLFLNSCPSSALVLTPLEGPLWLRTSPLHDVIPRGPAVCTKISSLDTRSVSRQAQEFKNKGCWRCRLAVPYIRADTGLAPFSFVELAQLLGSGSFS